MSNFTPLNQKRLTNVAYVRLKRKGTRFELACYRNKVVNWRNGVETDIDEVLQIDSIFLNVSRGEVASRKDLVKAFQTDNQEEIVKIILKEGQLQVSDLERKAELEIMNRDIATIISQKCVNPRTNRPYPFTVIARVLKTIHFAPSTTRTAKQQALEIIPKLQEHIEIERAKMGVKVTVAVNDTDTLKDWLKTENISPKTEKTSADQFQVECEIQPSLFRPLDGLCRGMPKVSAVFEEGNATVENEMARLDLNKSAAVSAGGSSSMFGFQAQPAVSPAATAPVAPAAATTGRKCSTAPGVGFATREELMAHYKTEWHKYNLQRKAAQLPVIGKEEFDGMTPDQLEMALIKPVDNKELADEMHSQTQKQPSKKKGKKGKKGKKNQNCEPTPETTPPPEEEAAAPSKKKLSKKQLRKQQEREKRKAQLAAANEEEATPLGEDPVPDVAEEQFDDDFFN